MFAKFKPTWMIDAIYNITPEELAAHQIKAVLTDLDNTLIAWNNPDGTKELRKWIDEMKAAKIPVLVISNNKASRIDRAVQHLGLDYIARAMKPSSRAFKEAEKRLGLSASDMLMVGDQVMTDIRGANGAGVRTVLVKPLVSSDQWNTKLNRAMERVVLKHLRKKHQDMNWRASL